MPIVNQIVKPKKGMVGVITWEDNVSNFISKLNKPKNSIVVRLDEKRILVSVDQRDSHLVTNLNIQPYESDESPSTSIFFPKHLSEEENQKVNSILSTLSSNGSITEDCASIKIVKSGTFINFPYNCSKDRALTNAFLQFLFV